MAQRVPPVKQDMSQSVANFIAPVTTVLAAKDTIRETLETLQGRKIDEKIFYFYVLDREGRLVGVVSTRKLLLANLDAKLEEVMDPQVATLSSEQTMSQALEVIEKLRLLAVPVVDGAGRLLGMIDVQHYVDEPVKEINTEMQKNIFQFIGISVEEKKLGTPWKGFKARMPWIFCNMASGLACAIISKVFQIVLAKVLILAMFIPLVLTLCESISMQAMTQCLTILHSPHRLSKMIRHRFSLEVKTVSLISLTSAIVIGLLSFLWGGGWGPVIVIGVSIFISVLISAVVGTAIPVGLRIFKMDPKIASGPVVLMIVDVIGTSIYLGFAQWLLITQGF